MKNIWNHHPVLWGKKSETSGNPQGEREFTYPSCESFMLLVGRFPAECLWNILLKPNFPGQFSTSRFIGGEVAQPVLGRSWNHRLWYFTPIPRIDRLKHQLATINYPKHSRNMAYGASTPITICWFANFPAIFNNPQLWHSVSFFGHSPGPLAMPGWSVTLAVQLDKDQAWFQHRSV